MISILLPTIRPHLYRRAVDSIARAAGLVKYEVIVVADFGPENLPKTTWIVRERRGVIDAIYLATLEATGDYLFVFNDESVLDVGSLESLYYYALTNPGKVLTPHHVPSFNFSYYGKPFAAFPFVHRDVVKKLGGLFDPAYRGFYADPDFSMRAHAAGVPIEVVHSATIRHCNEHDTPHWQSVSKYLDADRALFRSRWDHFGPFMDPQ